MTLSRSHSKLTRAQNQIYGIKWGHGDFHLDAGSNPVPQHFSMPTAACPTPACLLGSWFSFFLLIRGLTSDFTAPATLELSLISSVFRNNHYYKTPRAAGMQVGRTSTEQAHRQACVCCPFLPVLSGDPGPPPASSAPQSEGDQSLGSDIRGTQSLKTQLYLLHTERTSASQQPSQSLSVFICTMEIAVPILK